ncbi:MAG: hypothetical protein ABSD47_10185 [Candidatus Methylomirabilota bacterium]|jgi:hypothetical protein
MTTKADTIPFRWEGDLAAPVGRFLRNRAFRLQSSEVPFYEYRMDMYGYSERADLTVAVELKLRKWSRAVEQALLYQLCSDLVYIAMPREHVGRVDLEVFAKHGVGLIAVEERRCREVVRAVPSQVVRRHYRLQYLAMLQRRDQDAA